MIHESDKVNDLVITESNLNFEEVYSKHRFDLKLLCFLFVGETAEPSQISIVSIYRYLSKISGHTHGHFFGHERL